MAAPAPPAKKPGPLAGLSQEDLKRILIIGGPAAAVLVLVGAGGFFFLRGRRARRIEPILREITEENETVRTVELGRLEPGAAIPDWYFRFDPPPDVDLFQG